MALILAFELGIIVTIVVLLVLSIRNHGFVRFQKTPSFGAILPSPKISAASLSSG
jgi:hypothetical protein